MPFILDLLLVVATGSLAARGLLGILFESPLVVELINAAKGRRGASPATFLVTREDVSSWLLHRNFIKLHTLWSCRLCQSFWTSVVCVTGLYAATLCFSWLLYPFAILGSTGLTLVLCRISK